jgi:hypothetical protein
MVRAGGPSAGPSVGPSGKPDHVMVIRLGLGLWCLTPCSTIFQLYRGG